MSVKRSFWLIQIISWSLFTLVNLLGRGYFKYFHVSELINSVVLGFSLFCATSFLRYFLKKRLKANSVYLNFGVILIGCVIGGFISVFIYIAIIFPFADTFFSIPIEVLSQQMLLGSPVIFFLVLGWSAIYAVLRNQRVFNRTERKQMLLEQSLKSARLDVLLSQINPHFIFNAINNIRALILEDADKARDLLADLSEVMRYTMKVDKESLIALEDEIDIVEHYIALNKIQLEDKLTVNWQVTPETLALNIPPMVLQLLVENAIKHGVSKLKSGGKIDISTSVDNGNNVWHLVVENSGELRRSESSSGVGLKNISERLALVFGQAASFNIESAPIGVKATATLPICNQNDSSYGSKAQEIAAQESVNV